MEHLLGTEVQSSNKIFKDSCLNGAYIQHSQPCTQLATSDLYQNLNIYILIFIYINILYNIYIFYLGLSTLGGKAESTHFSEGETEAPSGAMFCPGSRGLTGDWAWIPSQCGRFPGKTYESIKPTNPINQSVFIRAYWVQLLFMQRRQGREEVAVRRRLRRPEAAARSREFGASFLLVGCSRL